jgi:glycosyltransferase involved in cell wall biosynthesis
MRIVIDMQGAQSTGSWNRGIGRYTLALASAIARNRGDHEILLVLNGAFPESIERIKQHFSELIPEENIRIWYSNQPTAFNNENNKWRREVAELAREAFIASLKPDFVLIGSLFEGLGDDAVVTIKLFDESIKTAVVLYDLIPYINSDIYLQNQDVKRWYLSKIEHLSRADLWLGISESSAQEGIDHLGFDKNKCVSISTDADEQFKVNVVSDATMAGLKRKYGIINDFIMYTGGIDYRKNIEGLIKAYALMPESIRANHQLAIVCSIQEETRNSLIRLGESLGLEENQLLLTGYVPEEDLVSLYNICRLFVFPSWHEGFGLPALEAMRCGAVVLGANTSSLPEVVGNPEALFDPYSVEDMAKLIERSLMDDQFRFSLKEKSIKQEKNFSWDKTAIKAITLIENSLKSSLPSSKSEKPIGYKPRLAFLSPLPPLRSGIAGYSSELIPALTACYEISVVLDQDVMTDEWIKSNCKVLSIEQFRERRKEFDRVLFHFGNSEYHKHMFDLLEETPGVVVLHDFFMSGVLNYMQAKNYKPDAMDSRLLLSHGYTALQFKRACTNADEFLSKYPCNFSVIEDALGLIVHSKYSKRLAESWYGINQEKWEIIPLLRETKVFQSRSDARRELGFDENDFLVCSFGMLGPTKMNDRLLRAWLDSGLSKTQNCHLIFVGENHMGDYGSELLEVIKRNKVKSKIKITGWTDDRIYDQYLAAADIGVQLRTLSRGESSSAVLDCMKYGLPTIVNSNGAMSDLASCPVWMIDDEFGDADLVSALETLWSDKELRYKLGSSAKEMIIEKHNSKICAEKYMDAIERFYDESHNCLDRVIHKISMLETKNQTDAELVQLSINLSKSFISIA